MQIENQPISFPELQQDEFSSEDPLHTKFMLEYLVTKCTFFCENPCFQAHPNDPIRRKPYRLENGCWNYIPQECLSGSECEFKSRCIFAHNPPEASYHPMLYKTIQCGYPLSNGACSKLGIYCFMAHGDMRKPSNYSLDPEIQARNEGTQLGQVEANRNNLENYSTYKVYDKRHYAVGNRENRREAFDVYSFKTRKCDKKSDHNEKTCLYFHQNSLDRRRRHNFAPKPCKNVYDYTLGTFENKECPNGDICKYAHTENEILYHAENYKKEQCKIKNCDLGDCCPYTHVEMNNKTIKDIEYEIKTMKDNHSVLVKLLEEKKKCSEKLKKFVCIACKKPAKEVLFCGHLTCGSCSIPKCCGVSKKGVKFK